MNAAAERQEIHYFLRQTGMPNPILFVSLCLRVSLRLFGNYALNGQVCYLLRQEQGTILPVYSIHACCACRKKKDEKRFDFPARLNNTASNKSFLWR